MALHRRKTAWGRNVADIRVLIVDDSTEARCSMRAMLATETGFAVVGEAGDGRSAIALAQELRPDAAVVDVRLPDISGIEVARRLASDPGVAVVLVSVEGTPEAMRRAMASGARDYLTKPFSASDLVQALRAACRRSKEPSRGQLAVLFGAKGGAGRTTLAVNLAVAAGRMDSARPAVLVDLALPFGQVAAHCDFVPQSHLGDACRSQLTLLEEMCEAPPGLPIRVLAAPPDPAVAADLAQSGAEAVGRVLDALLARHRFVVADTSADLAPLTLCALERANIALVVTTPEVPAVQITARLLHLLVDQLGYDARRLRIVVNRPHPAPALPIRVVAETLGFPVAVEMPFDAEAAANVGIHLPAAGRRRRTALGSAAYQLAQLALADVA